MIAPPPGPTDHLINATLADPPTRIDEYVNYLHGEITALASYINVVACIVGSITDEQPALLKTLETELDLLLENTHSSMQPKAYKDGMLNQFKTLRQTISEMQGQ